MNRQKTAKGERHSSPKTIHHIQVREAENGGHVVTHHFNQQADGYHEPEDHVFGPEQGGEALSHIASAAHINSEAEAADTGENTEES